MREGIKEQNIASAATITTTSSNKETVKESRKEKEVKTSITHR